MAKWGEIKCPPSAALEERLDAAQRDAKEAEAYAEELEAKLAQQDDLVQAAVAAALREAAEQVRPDRSPSGNGIVVAELHRTADAILALITPDAQAALDRVVAEVLTQAADAVEDYCSDAPDLAGHGHSGAIRDVIIAIRKGGE